MTLHLRSRCIAVAAIPIWLALIAGNLHAQTVIYVDVNATGPIHDGTRWCSAYTDLQLALADSALTDGNPGDEVLVADGLYTPSPSNRIASFRLSTGVAIKGGYAGCGATNPDERDFVAFETTLSGDLAGNDGPGFSGNSENSAHIVRAEAVDQTAILDGFTITGGNADLNNPSDRGAAIFTFNFPSPGSPTIRNCIVRGNTAIGKGAGMYIDNASPVLENCVFAGNESPTGAAIFIFGSQAAPAISNCTVFGNTATANAGGIFTTGGSPIISNTIVWGNSDSGGMDESAQMNPGSANLSLDYSIVQGLTGQFLKGIGNVNDDPMFADALGLDGVAGTSDDDLTLSILSPAVNTGDPASVSVPGDTDAASLTRLVGCRVDRGAFETAVMGQAADFNANGSFNLADFASFQLCFDAPTSNSAWSDACLCIFDDDNDNDVTLNDFPPLQSLIDTP